MKHRKHKMTKLEIFEKYQFQIMIPIVVIIECAWTYLLHGIVGHW